MKYKYLIIIFLITIAAALIIMFYNPDSKYLGVYKNEINIEYDKNIENYIWLYSSTKELFDIETINESKWKLIPKSDGEDTITFYYTNDNTKENSIYEILYTFKIVKNKIYWTKGEAKGLLDFPNPS